MRIARSTCCRVPKGSADDTAPVEATHAIEDAFEACPARLGDHRPGRLDGAPRQPPRQRRDRDFMNGRCISLPNG